MVTAFTALCSVHIFKLEPETGMFCPRNWDLKEWWQKHDHKPQWNLIHGQVEYIVGSVGWTQSWHETWIKQELDIKSSHLSTKLAFNFRCFFWNTSMWAAFKQTTSNFCNFCQHKSVNHWKSSVIYQHFWGFIVFLFEWTIVCQNLWKIRPGSLTNTSHFFGGMVGQQVPFLSNGFKVGTTRADPVKIWRFTWL